MKALLAAIFMFVIGDYAINHGNGTHQVAMFVKRFGTSVSQASSDSVFNQ